MLSRLAIPHANFVAKYNEHLKFFTHLSQKRGNQKLDKVTNFKDWKYNFYFDWGLPMDKAGYPTRANKSANLQGDPQLILPVQRIPRYQSLGGEFGKILSSLNSWKRGAEICNLYCNDRVELEATSRKLKR